MAQGPISISAPSHEPLGASLPMTVTISGSLPATPAGQVQIDYTVDTHQGGQGVYGGGAVRPPATCRRAGASTVCTVSYPIDEAAAAGPNGTSPAPTPVAGTYTVWAAEQTGGRWITSAPIEVVFS